MANVINEGGAVERFTALSISQPMAALLTVPTWEDAEGVQYGARRIYVGECLEEPCGELLICAKDSPAVPGYGTGETCGLVDFYAVKRTDEFTPEEWQAAGLKPGERSGWGYFFRNSRRVVEMPVEREYDFEEVEFPAGEITEYPRVLRLGADGYRKVTGR